MLQNPHTVPRIKSNIERQTVKRREEEEKTHKHVVWLSQQNNNIINVRNVNIITNQDIYIINTFQAKPQSERVEHCMCYCMYVCVCMGYIYPNLAIVRRERESKDTQ